jgi:uncharacterized protein YegL
MTQPEMQLGGSLSSRPLHFILIADCSGSMGVDGKIQALNTAVREALPEMRRVADQNPNAEVLIRAVAFSNGAWWHVATPTPVESFVWPPLEAGGMTDMGAALREVAAQLKMPPMSDRALPPVLVLLSDGQPTDDFSTGLKELLSQAWARKAVRIAIALGSDADLDPLQQFIGNIELQPLEAKNAADLVRFIKWASTAVLQSASSPASMPAGRQRTGNVPLPPPPEAANALGATVAVGDVW